MCDRIVNMMQRVCTDVLKPGQVGHMQSAFKYLWAWQFSFLKLRQQQPREQSAIKVNWLPCFGILTVSQDLPQLMLSFSAVDFHYSTKSEDFVYMLLLFSTA